MDVFTAFSVLVGLDDSTTDPPLTSTVSEETHRQVDCDTVNPHGSRVFCVIC
jgi:hypothetical protein